MHKALLILGLLRGRSLSGYDLNRIVRAHGELYTDLKKANLYYLLDRLSKDGYLEVRSEGGARGPLGERLIYSLTDGGRGRFIELLRETLRTFEPAHTGVDVAIVFLSGLPPAEALALLGERRAVVATRRSLVRAELAEAPVGGPLAKIAADHLLCLIDAELKWIDRSLAKLRKLGWGATPSKRSGRPAKDGLDHNS
jgi:DNA-binding PadR family transcriptional regulator